MNNDTRLLFEAASFNNIPAVKKLLKKKRPPSINFESKGGDNALNMAVANNHEDMVTFLVGNGAEVNKKFTKMSPLLLAIKFDLTVMARVLLQLGASLDIGWFDGKRLSPIRYAVRNLNYRMLEFLIQSGANVSAADPSDKRTALHEVGDYLDSATNGSNIKLRLKIAKLLLKHKADVNATDDSCRTPLDGAIIDNVELTKYLIKEGAKVRRKMNNGFLVEYVLYVVNLNSPELVGMCLERGGNYAHAALVDEHLVTAYHRALKESIPEVVKVFWKFGCPVDLPESAEATGNGTQVKCCVEVSRVNIKLFQTQLDLIQAISLNDFNKVLSTIKEGAEPKGTSVQTSSPLHLISAIKNGDPKIARILLENGVPVNKLSGTAKKNSLFFALLNSNLGVMKEILKFGGCFSNSDKEFARCVQNKEGLKLLEEVAKTFELAKNGSSQVCKRIRKFITAGNKEMAEILMNCVDSQGSSLMNLAFQNGHVKLAEKLMILRVNHF